MKKIGRIRAAILSLVGGYPIELNTTDSRLYDTGLVNTAGQTITQTTAMSISAVYACVRLISQSISIMPFRVYEKTPQGRRLAEEHPIDRLINRVPNPDTVSSVFWQAAVAQMLLRDGAHIELSRIGPNVVKMRLLTRDRLQITEYSGVKTYRYTEKDGTQREIPRSKLMILIGFSLDGETGVSAITYGAAVFGNALAGTNAANSQYEKGVQPTMYIKNPTVVKADQRTAFREAMKTITGALNAGETVVLEAGQEVGVINISAKDAQLLESRGFSVEEVCRWFGVPPHMIGHTSKVTSWGSGIEEMNIGYLIYTLQPYLTNIAKIVNNTLFTVEERARYYAEHVPEGLLKADTTKRAAFYTAMVGLGVMTRDHVRELENWPLMGGNAEVLTVNPGIVPLDSIGPADESQQP